MFHLDRPALKDGRKLHCCLYCGEWQYRIPRHMERKHKSEQRVENILKLGKTERNQEFAKLRTEGDYQSNIERIKHKNYNLTVVRKGKLPEQKYVPCLNCYGLFNPKTLNKHAKLCAGNSSEVNGKKRVLKHSRMLLESALTLDKKYENFSANVISRMFDDQYTALAKNDELLMLYGYTLYRKGGDEKFSEISNNLRSMARLIIKYRELHDASVSANELIDPAHWDSIISTVKVLVKYSGIEEVGIPSLLLRLGRSLAALASAKRTVGIKTKNPDIKQDARDFLEILMEEWNTYANHAQATLEARRDKTPELLPLTKDIQKLRLFLLTEIDKIVSKLEKREVEREEKHNLISKIEFSYLQKLCLVRLITFNARRGGEASKIKLEQWLNCDKWKREEDIQNIEDPMEKLLAQRLNLVYSKGKRKKRVPTLFTDELSKALRYLVKYRSNVGVLEKNIYLFPCPTRNSKNHIRGWEVVHEISLKASLQKPNLVTSTKIRKHMATVLQLLDMNNAELEWVTEHLGHTADVHKTWYRQEASTIELTKVAKLLIAKDKNVNFKNKKMKDITGKTVFLTRSYTRFSQV